VCAVLRSRRDLLRALGSSLTAAPLDCGRPARPRREGGRIVVPFWYAYGGRNRTVLLDLVGRYNASQSRTVVRAVFQGDYFESLAKLRSAIAAGTPPALSHVILEVLPYLARAGVIEPLDDYDGAGDLPFVRELAQEGAFDSGPAGEIGDPLRDPRRMPLYGIPFNRSTPIAYANGRIFKDEGARIPTTWDELAAVARQLTKRAPNGEVRWGFEVPISWWYWVAMVGQAGGRLVEPDGRLSLGGAAGEAAIRFWQRLVRSDGSMRPPPGRDYQAWQSTNESFLQQRIAMMWTSTAFVRYLEDNAKFPVVAAPLPRNRRAAVPTGGTMFVLLREAAREEKVAAWDFVRWMCQTEQTISWATRTGYMPVTRPAVEQLIERGYYKKYPNDRVAYDQLASVDPWPWSPDLFRIERDVVEPRLEDAVLTGRDAHEIMQEARDAAHTPA
jgi:sn-glycerol 3-phosphate transport system substrate-binding protein